jgi:hypothetical protein
MIGNASISVPNTRYNHKSSEFIAGAKMTAQRAVSSRTAAEQEVADRFVGPQFRMKESKRPLLLGSASSPIRSLKRPCAPPELSSPTSVVVSVP